MALTDASTLLLLAVGVALVGLLPFAGDAAVLLYGGQYTQAGDAVRVLVLAESFGFFSSLAVTILLVANGHRRYPLI